MPSASGADDQRKRARSRSLLDLTFADESSTRRPRLRARCAHSSLGDRGGESSHRDDTATRRSESTHDNERLQLIALNTRRSNWEEGKAAVEDTSDTSSCGKVAVVQVAGFRGAKPSKSRARAEQEQSSPAKELPRARAAAATRVIAAGAFVRDGSDSLEVLLGCRDRMERMLLSNNSKSVDP